MIERPRQCHDHEGGRTTTLAVILCILCSCLIMWFWYAKKQSIAIVHCEVTSGMHKLGCSRWSKKITYCSSVLDVKMNRTAYVADVGFHCKNVHQA